MSQSPASPEELTGESRDIVEIDFAQDAIRERAPASTTARQVSPEGEYVPGYVPRTSREQNEPMASPGIHDGIGEEVVRERLPGSRTPSPDSLVLLSTSAARSSIPSRLVVVALSETSTQHVWSLCNDAFFRELVDQNQDTLVTLMLERNYRRLESRWNFRGRSFIDSLQEWTKYKGVYIDMQATADSTSAFVQHYIKCNDESECPEPGDLHKLADGLVALQLHAHTPQEYGEIYSGDGRMRYEEDLYNAILTYSKFPSYAGIESSNNYLDDVLYKPQFLGPVRDAVGNPNGYVRLTTLHVPRVGDLLYEARNVMEDEILARLELPKLPEIFAYCVPNEQHMLSIEDAVRASSNVHVVQGMDKVAQLEKIDVL
jgi:hypothetical protein